VAARAAAPGAWVRLLQRLLGARKLLRHRVRKQLALQGAERFGPGAELDAPQARDLVVEMLDAQVELLDLALLGGDALVALGECSGALGQRVAL
jgi:hypothetical protein